MERIAVRFGIAAVAVAALFLPNRGKAQPVPATVDAAGFTLSPNAALGLLSETKTGGLAELPPELRRSLVGDRGPTTPRGRHLRLASGPVMFGFDAARVHSESRRGPDAGLPMTGKFSTWTGELKTSLSTGHGAFQFNAAGIADARKPPMVLDDGHWIKSTTASASLGWQGDDSLAISAGFYDVRSTQRAILDQQVALAAGEPIAEHGPRLSASYMPILGHGRRFLRLGIEVSAGTVGAADIAALGARNTHDNRATGSLRMHFR